MGNVRRTGKPQTQTGQSGRGTIHARIPCSANQRSRIEQSGTHPGKYSGWVIIDTPPSDAGVVQAAINAGDVVIIPCQPSVSDLTHAGRTYAAARNGIVLLTRVKPRTKLARNSISELDEEGIARFETVITEREAVKNMYGTTEIDNKEYSSVVQELIDYLSEINLVEE